MRPAMVDVPAFETRCRESAAILEPAAAAPSMLKENVCRGQRDQVVIGRFIHRHPLPRLLRSRRALHDSKTLSESILPLSPQTMRSFLLSNSYSKLYQDSASFRA